MFSNHRLLECSRLFWQNITECFLYFCTQYLLFYPATPAWAFSVLHQQREYPEWWTLDLPCCCVVLVLLWSCMYHPLLSKPLKSKLITGMRYWIKLLRLQKFFLSLVQSNVASFLLTFSTNPHFNGVDVPCLTSMQSTKRGQWQINNPLKFTLPMDPLPFGSLEFIWKRKNLWHTFYKEKQFSSCIDRFQDRKSLCTQALAVQVFAFLFSFLCWMAQNSDCVNLCFGISWKLVLIILQ